MQKKVLWSSIIVLVIILSSVFFITNYKKEVPVVDEAISCEPYLNIADASKTGSLRDCDCLTDNNQKMECQNKITQAATYTKALQQNDLNACNTINDVGMREACISITKAELEFIKQNEAKK